MPWQGFLKESKSYMNYQGVWPEWEHARVFAGGWTVQDRRRWRRRFWYALPRAWLRFHYFILRDWVIAAFK